MANGDHRYDGPYFRSTEIALFDDRDFQALPDAEQLLLLKLHGCSLNNLANIFVFYPSKSSR